MRESSGSALARRKYTEDGLAILGKPSWREVTMADVEAGCDRLGDPVNRRARHVVGEIARTVAAARALEAGDVEALGPLMFASHDSLRDDCEVSCPELDTMVEIARNIGRSGGVINARYDETFAGSCSRPPAAARPDSALDDPCVDCMVTYHDSTRPLSGD